MGQAQTQNSPTFHIPCTHKLDTILHNILIVLPMKQSLYTLNHQIYDLWYHAGAQEISDFRAL